MNKGDIANIVYMTILAAGIVIYYIRAQKRKNQPDNQATSPKKRNNSGIEFIEKLEALEYFKWTNQENLVELKAEMISNYDHSWKLSTLEKNELPVCHRLFHADAETLFEEGGFIEFLNRVQSAFTKRGLNLELEEHFEEYKNNVANQWIEVNGTKYTIYDNLDGENAEWEIATKAMLNLLNSELKNQNSDELVYPVHEGNDAQIVFLTPIQADLIKF